MEDGCCFDCGSPWVDCCCGELFIGYEDEEDEEDEKAGQS